MTARVAPGRFEAYTCALRYQSSHSIKNGGSVMSNPLDSLWGTVISGVILTIVLYYVAIWLMGG